MNANKLKGKIVENGLKVTELAVMLDIDRATLYRKLKNVDKITIGEASKMTEALGLSKEEAIEIFL